MTLAQLKILINQLPSSMDDKEITFLDKCLNESHSIERFEIDNDGTVWLTTREKRLNGSKSYRTFELVRPSKTPLTRKRVLRRREKKCACWISRKTCPVHR